MAFDPAEFVDRFTRWWAAPDPEVLGALLAPGVVLRQPKLPTTHGLAESQEGFRQLLAAIPDLHAEVHRWAAEGETVFIEFTLIGTIGGEQVTWENVDRFTLGDDGLATERVNYQDGTL
jgi:limonene-1,2-epoxide hydrolase